MLQSKRHLVIAFLAMFGHGYSLATEKLGCETSTPLKTPFGDFSKTECVASNGNSTDSLNINGKAILKDRRLFKEERDAGRALWIYTSGTIDEKTACPVKLYLLDIRVSPPKIFSFGVRGACNKFDWVSWGEKRSVIAIKKNVRFVYEGGQLKGPVKSEKTWLSVEPPHTGGGLAEEDALPFVEEVFLPK